MNDGKLLEERDRGGRAERFLKDELFVGAVEAISNRIWDEFRQGSPDDLIRLQLELKLIDQIQKQLKTHIDTGKLAATALDRIKEAAQKMRIVR